MLFEYDLIINSETKLNLSEKFKLIITIKNRLKIIK